MDKIIKVFLQVSIWGFTTLYITTLLGKCFTMPSTIANIIGIIILLLYIVISIKTKCFTNIKLKNKK